MCDPESCPGGNCVGCKDGKTWCQDPRCDPYCPACAIPQDYDFMVNVVMIIIVMCLLLVIFIIGFVYGPTLIRPHNDISKMKADYPVFEQYPSE